MPRLLLKFNDEVLKVIDSNKELITLGRNLKNDIQIDNLAVSNFHAHIVCHLEHFFIEDLGSTNGSFVNGQRINGEIILHNNDVVRIAWNTFKFIDNKEAILDKTLIEAELVLSTDSILTIAD